MNEEIPGGGTDPASYMLINVGAPFLIGMAVGYFMKKALKVGLLLLGLALVLFFVADYYDIIGINQEGLTNAVDRGSAAVNTFGSFLINNLKAYGGATIGGVAGFFVGLKMG